MTTEIVTIRHIRFVTEFDPADDCGIFTIRAADEHDSPVGPDLGEMFTSLRVYGEKDTLYDVIRDAAWNQHEDRVVSDREEHAYRSAVDRRIA